MCYENFVIYTFVLDNTVLLHCCTKNMQSELLPIFYFTLFFFDHIIIRGLKPVGYLFPYSFCVYLETMKFLNDVAVKISTKEFSFLKFAVFKSLSYLVFLSNDQN